MQGKDTTTSTFHQLFNLVMSSHFKEELAKMGADRYVKKLKTGQLIIFLAYAQLEQQHGLRDISNSFNNMDLQQAIGLDSISASQISRRLRELSQEALRFLWKYAVNEVAKDISYNAITQELGRLHLIDSTTISLCLTRYSWADFRKTKAGVKLHLRLKFWEDGVMPDEAVITPARPADKTQMDALS